MQTIKKKKTEKPVWQIPDQKEGAKPERTQKKVYITFEEAKQHCHEFIDKTCDAHGIL